MTSVLVPVAYLVIVFGGLFVFSFYYRKATSQKKYEPYFPSHPERNAYVTLLQKNNPPAHDALLKSALIRRAMADVQRVVRIREDKAALQNLLQKGSVGDDLWNSLLAAEKEMEAEIMEVVGEANSFVEGWGQVIFQTANEMIVNEKMRAIFERTNEAKTEIEAKYELTRSRPTPAVIEPSAAGSAPPTTPAKTANGLLSPTSPTYTDSVVSSDGEGSVTSASGTRGGKKKNKKRK
ncbi:Pre protein translocase subunit Sec66-domain-containing protein [Crepidotus variabilis]|uniref:Pre protein translocase subunit Sec66-domain-containing protein n=1 Tax=Crepidotus variabilis TaxID=179855 RepID=A0A9P6ENS9_9AGAR|nr:Pre protein translocase subunit Sec66-domain-containing protein [Crepidotus variabilis]